MAEASGRDRIARQYAANFKDVLEVGMRALASGLAKWTDAKWASLAVYLHFLSDEPDTHVVRKHGPVVGEEVRRTAMVFHAQLSALERPDDLLPDLLVWDDELKARSINPGTCADLTVATLFARRLDMALPPTCNSD